VNARAGVTPAARLIPKVYKVLFAISAYSGSRTGFEADKSDPEYRLTLPYLGELLISEFIAWFARLHIQVDLSILTESPY
jgi:hypothetical protein